MADPKEEQKKNEQEEQVQGKRDQEKAADGKPSAAAIAKAIEGLTFRTNKEIPVLDDSTGKPVMEGGKPKVRYVPDERPLRPKDVLSAAFDGAALVIVTADGSKHRIGK